MEENYIRGAQSIKITTCNYTIISITIINSVILGGVAAA